MAIDSLTEHEIRAIIGKPSTVFDTHRPVLAEAIIRTSGAILELGMGEGSTPGLHEIAMRTGRRVVSYESDAQWFGKFKHLAQSPHSLRLVGDYQDCFCEEPWGAVLVDHAESDFRVREIHRLASWAQVVVVHDTEDPRYRYWSAIGAYKFHFHYRSILPWTSAFSNFIDVSKWQIAESEPIRVR